MVCANSLIVLMCSNLNYIFFKYLISGIESDSMNGFMFMYPCNKDTSLVWSIVFCLTQL